MKIIPKFVKNAVARVWRYFFRENIDDVIDRHFISLYEQFPDIESIRAERFFARKFICVSFMWYCGKETREKMPKTLDGYPVEVGVISSCCCMPDIRADRKTDEDRYEELKRKVEWRAASRAGILKWKQSYSPVNHHRYGELYKPSIHDITDDELERYYYYLYRIWGIE